MQNLKCSISVPCSKQIMQEEHAKEKAEVKELHAKALDQLETQYLEKMDAFRYGAWLLGSFVGK